MPLLHYFRLPSKQNLPNPYGWLCKRTDERMPCCQCSSKEHCKNCLCAKAAVHCTDCFPCRKGRYMNSTLVHLMFLQHKIILILILVKVHIWPCYSRASCVTLCHWFTWAGNCMVHFTVQCVQTIPIVSAWYLCQPYTPYSSFTCPFPFYAH